MLGRRTERIVLAPRNAPSGIVVKTPLKSTLVRFGMVFMKSKSDLSKAPETINSSINGTSSAFINCSSCPLPVYTVWAIPFS